VGETASRGPDSESLPVVLLAAMYDRKKAITQSATLFVTLIMS